MSRRWLGLLLILTNLGGRFLSAFQMTKFVSRKSARLLGPIVTSTSAASDVTCIRHCQRHRDVCISVNYKPVTRECQLCSETPDLYGTVVQSDLAWNLHYQKGPCDKGWIYYGSSCYRFEPTTMTMSAASDFCANLGARLLEINDLEENQFAMTVATGAGLVWLGLNDLETEGTFVWPSGAPLDYSNFAPGEGLNNREDCVFMATSRGRWGDGDCNRLETLMCEQPIL